MGGFYLSWLKWFYLSASGNDFFFEKKYVCYASGLSEVLFSHVHRSMTPYMIFFLLKARDEFTDKILRSLLKKLFLSAYELKSHSIKWLWSVFINWQSWDKIGIDKIQTKIQCIEWKSLNCPFSAVMEDLFNIRVFDTRPHLLHIKLLNILLDIVELTPTENRNWGIKFHKQTF